MGYPTGQMPVFLIAAALIGAAAAWFLRGVRWRGREKEIVGQLRRTHDKLDMAEGEIRRQSAELKDGRSELDERSRQVQARLEELEALKQTLRKRDESLARLESELVQLRDEKEVEIGSLREHIGALEPLQRRLDQSQSERNRLQGELRTLREQLAAAHGKAGRCRCETASLSDTGRPCEPPERTPVPETDCQAETLSAGQRFDRPGQVDDLKRIRGIGPVLEQTLNRLGIASYAQIGRFSAEDIERVGSALNVFPGRIERDDWIGGAREQYRKKYGKMLDA